MVYFSGKRHHIPAHIHLFCSKLSWMENKKNGVTCFVLPINENRKNRFCMVCTYEELNLNGIFLPQYCKIRTFEF